MAKFTKEDEIQIFFGACNFLKGLPDFEVNEDNFKYMAARAFKLYKSFMEVGDNDKRRQN